MTAKPRIECGSDLDVPVDIAVCPYCGAQLAVQVTGTAMLNVRLWVVDEITTDCKGEPADEESPEWEEWDAEHGDMPYVHLLPVEEQIIEWLNRTHAVTGVQV